MVDLPGWRSPEKDCCWLWLTFRQPVCKSSSELIMTSTQAVKTSTIYRRTTPTRTINQYRHWLTWNQTFHCITRQYRNEGFTQSWPISPSVKIVLIIYILERKSIRLFLLVVSGLVCEQLSRDQYILQNHWYYEVFWLLVTTNFQPPSDCLVTPV